MDLDQRASQGGPSSHVTLKTICGAVRHRDVKERSSLCVFVNLFIPTISTRTQGFLQTILFSVLASFSLSAVLHAAEVIVAGCLLLASIHNFVLPRQKSETCSHGFGPSKTGATGIATPLRRLTLPRLLESDRRRAHRSAAPVLS